MMIKMFLASLFILGFGACTGSKDRSQGNTTKNIDTLKSEISERTTPPSFSPDNRSKAARSKIDALDYDSLGVYKRTFPFHTNFFYDSKFQIILSIHIEYPYIDFVKTNLSDRIDFDQNHFGLIGRQLSGYLQDGIVKVLMVTPMQIDFTVVPYDIVYKEGKVVESINTETYTYESISRPTKDSLINLYEQERIHIQEGDSFIRAELAYSDRERLSELVQEVYHQLQSTNTSDQINLDDITVLLSVVVERDGMVRSDVGFEYKDMKDYVDFSHEIKNKFEEDLTNLVKTMKFSPALNNDKKPIKSLFQLAFPFYQT